jgi:3-isopropylmalate dehydrogenase
MLRLWCGNGPRLDVLRHLRKEGVKKTLHVALIGGDGIGPEVIDAAVPVLERAAAGSGTSITWESLPFGADHYLKTGETLPEPAFRHLQDDVDAILLGAVGDPRVPGNEHARDILLGLRFRLDLYINFRPCVLLSDDLCPLKPALGASNESGDRRSIDFVIFRENTEGLYLGRGTSRNVGTPEEEQVAEEVHTARGVARIIRAAFEWARANSRTLVTMADKSNAIPAHRLWRRLFDSIGAEFPEIAREQFYVDALAMELVRQPQRFQVIVTNNLLGDILSDLGAQLVGGLGLAASANLHPGRPGLFEPVHGSAPTLAGRGTANPVAAILTGALMLDQLRLPEAAARVRAAARDTVIAGIRTPDIGGSSSTAEVAKGVAARIG